MAVVTADNAKIVLNAVNSSSNIAEKIDLTWTLQSL